MCSVVGRCFDSYITVIALQTQVYDQLAVLQKSFAVASIYCREYSHIQSHQNRNVSKQNSLKLISDLNRNCIEQRQIFSVYRAEREESRENVSSR